MSRWIQVVVCSVTFIIVMAVLGALIRPVTDGFVDVLDATFGKYGSGAILFAFFGTIGYFSYRTPRSPKGS